MRYHKAVLYLNEQVNNPEEPNPHVADVYCHADGNDSHNKATFSVRFCELEIAGIRVDPLRTLGDEQIIELSGHKLTSASIETVEKKNAGTDEPTYRLTVDPEEKVKMPTFPVERI